MNCRHYRAGWTRLRRVWLALSTLLMAAPAAAAQSADSASRTAAAPPPLRIDWLSDRRTFVVGDIIKVLVDEFALATADKGTSAEASRQRRMGIDAHPPASGGSATDPIAGSFETSDRSKSAQRGSATRKTRYVGEIPVRVVEVTPEGLLRVEGQKVIDIDRNRQELTLTGLVRPMDVDARDIVASSAIADAQLVYTSTGLDRPRSGILSRIIGIFWP